MARRREVSSGWRPPCWVSAAVVAAVWVAGGADKAWLFFGRPAEGIPPEAKVGSALRPGGPPRGRRSSVWEVLDTSNLPGKTAIVTGANSGIGYHTALALAYGGVRVFLACRNLRKAREAKQKMEVALKEAKPQLQPKLEVAELDLSSLASVRRFSEDFKAKSTRLDLLCLNAGVMALPGFTPSADGLEMQFATNHLGHFALVRQLEGLLRASAPARVVTLSSEAHRFPPKPMDFANVPPRPTDYTDWGAYQQSKLANLLFSRELARRFKAEGVDVTSNAVHPGVIPTPLGRQQLLKGSFMLNLMQDRTEEQGAATSIYCLTAKAVEGVSGQFFRDCAEGFPAPYARDDEAAKRLWAISEQLLEQSILSK